jgi:hypothetical protein
MGFVVIGLLLLPRFGRAHTPGLSVADFEVTDSGRVDARLVFASAEALGGIDPDRNHDGQVTAADLAAASDDLRAFVIEGVDVSADESRCPAAFRGASLAERDGLALEASYACPAGASEVAVTLFYLSHLPREHREVARIVAGSRIAEAVLTGDRRRLALKLRAGGTVPLARRTVLLLVMAGAAAAAAVALVLRRRALIRPPDS